MGLEERTAFVLGAGFTKAFLPSAPLLVDDYYGSDLKAKFAAFPELAFILNLELDHPDHRPGWINLERLMTRLAGGMPYDFGTGLEKLREVLLAEVKQAFLRRLTDAKRAGVSGKGELSLFAIGCMRENATCITFNYDDLLDEALWRNEPRYVSSAWAPDWGYGFPCQSSEACVRGPAVFASGAFSTSFSSQPSEGDLSSSRLEALGPGPMQLLKLHGSINWRIPLGHPRPYAVDAIRHHEPWFEYYGRARRPLNTIEPFLEPDLFIVPPIMTKTDLIEQPVLRLVWSLAIKALREATHAVFMGYSMPLTDVACCFLFREGLSHLNPCSQITVVDYARDSADKDSKLARLLPAYQAVFPGITKDRFEFCGAVDWVRTHFSQWLYDSKGKPVAFLALGRVFTCDGQLIGEIRSYFPGCQDVWNRFYKCDIVQGNRLLVRVPPPTEDRGPAAPLEMSGVPSIPEPLPPIELPPGFEDVNLETQK
jgi:hypothetical protein